MLVLGLGNRLMKDDAAGPLVTDLLAGRALEGVVIRDGGTMGMNLLPDIEDAEAVIAIDAAYFDEPPGTVKVFIGDEMDRQLTGVKKSAHEVALSDLMSAAAIQGASPLFRALVAVQPEKVELGMEPTPPVKSALSKMVEEVLALRKSWQQQMEAI